jgi:hypothetical protein
MRCPGQDKAYWKEDPAFEMPCPKCGADVEVFRDESTARCGQCDHRFKNPKIDLNCARWCAYAKECVGFAPPKQPSSNLGEGALASRLIQAVKEEFNENPERIARSLVAFQHARELARAEGGDPRVVLMASLLLEIDTLPAAGEKSDEIGPPTRIMEILAELGLDDETIRRVCRIIADCRSSQSGQSQESQSLESRIVSDSDTLARLSSPEIRADRSRVEETIENRMRTPAGKKRARELFLG